MPSILRSRAVRVSVTTALAVGLTALVVTPSSASDGGSVEVRIRDNCEATSFNAALGAPVCQGSGNTTFGEFVAALATGGHPKWRFQPSSVEVSAGTRFVAVNRGGEPHTFTEVSQFGKGHFEPLLDAALGPDAPDAIPVAPVVPIFQAGRQDLGVLTPGTHKFQCIIHPWMRTTVVVKHR